jgi:hypothetical protein
MPKAHCVVDIDNARVSFLEDVPAFPQSDFLVVFLNEQMKALIFIFHRVLTVGRSIV